MTDQQTPSKAPEHVNSERLFNDSNEIIIVHAGEEYRLRITRAGKLILTK